MNVPRSFIKVRSWHVLALVDAAGWRTRCGILVTVQHAPVSDTLPLGERSCESCLRDTVKDDERLAAAREAAWSPL